jgi:hypothetical protein
MKMKFLLALVAGIGLAALCGCVGKVSGGHAAGMPFVRDTVTGSYKRTVDQVFNAAKDVMLDNGAISEEKTFYETNMAKTIEGKVNQCSVWVRVQAVDAQVTDISVQARTEGGSSNIDLAHFIEKQVAIKLATR